MVGGGELVVGYGPSVVGRVVVIAIVLVAIVEHQKVRYSSILVLWQYIFKSPECNTFKLHYDWILQKNRYETE